MLLMKPIRVGSGPSISWALAICVRSLAEMFFKLAMRSGLDTNKSSVDQASSQVLRIDDPSTRLRPPQEILVDARLMAAKPAELGWRRNLCLGIDKVQRRLCLQPVGKPPPRGRPHPLSDRLLCEILYKARLSRPGARKGVGSLFSKTAILTVSEPFLRNDSRPLFLLTRAQRGPVDVPVLRLKRSRRPRGPPLGPGPRPRASHPAH